MNSTDLTKTIRDLKLTEVAALNTLQENGVISDNVISGGDVADDDCEKSVRFLSGKLL